MGIRFDDKQSLNAFIAQNKLLIAPNKNMPAPMYILKRIVLSNNREEHIIKLPTNKRDLLEKIVVSREEPWILQEFINGDDVTACVYVNNGNVQMYVDSICCDCCVNWHGINNEHIKDWLLGKCKQFKLNGIMCFDFMVRKADGMAFVLECNPRPHSCTLLMNDPSWIVNMVGNDKKAQMYDMTQMGVDKKHVCWLFHELLRLIGVLNMFPTQYDLLKIMAYAYREDKGCMFVDEFGFVNFNIANVLVGQDAILNVYDPWPVMVSHAVHMPKLIIMQILNGCKGWSVFDLCIVKLVGNEM